VILGSGLGEGARRLKRAVSIPYRDIPHFTRPSVAGHAGAIHLGDWGVWPVAVLEGRSHFYEGCTPAELAFPVRVLARAGVEAVVLVCAAGGIARHAIPGSFMLFSDHLNFQGMNPLAGPHDPRWGERFVDLTEAYDRPLRRQARRAATACRLRAWEGVYAALAGPSYETPAEIRALRALGAASVGMSTVPEVLTARQAGLRVLAMAVIANRAAGLSRRPLSHREVLEAGKHAAERLGRLLDELLARLTL
jgi:purine-nucleoside phosphorylase